MADICGDRMIWNFPDNLVGVSMRLKNRELWQKFNEVGTEMIITKPGRRMFPYVEVKLDGLDPEDSYVIVLELRQCSEYRYRFQANQWVEGGRANPPLRSIDNMFVLSPKKGKEWMRDACSMYFVKITNSNERLKHKSEEERPLLLTSMQKYMPVVHVIKTESKFHLTERPMTSFLLPEGEFIAVTAYQNVAVKELKVLFNPFAKAFRPGASSNRKRRSNHILEGERFRLTSDCGSSSGTSSASPCPIPSTSSASPGPIPSTSSASPCRIPSTSSASPCSIPSTSSASPCSIPSTSSASPCSIPSTSSAIPSSPSTSSTAVERKVADENQNYQTHTIPPPHIFCPTVSQLAPYPTYREQATRMVEMMQQYMLVRPWEVPPVTICNSNPYGFNIPLPVYWNSMGYPVPPPPFYPALPPPPAPAYTYENELIDLSMRAHVKEETEENAT